MRVYLTAGELFLALVFCRVNGWSGGRFCEKQKLYGENIWKLIFSVIGMGEAIVIELVIGLAGNIVRIVIVLIFCQALGLLHLTPVTIVLILACKYCMFVENM